MVRAVALLAVACTASCTNDFDELFADDAAIADTSVASDSALPDTRDASEPDTTVAVDAADSADTADTIAAADVDAGCSETTYRDMILCDKPMAYLRLADPSGTTANDEVGAHNGTYYGTIMLGASGIVSDKAVHLGSGDTVSLAGSGAFEFVGNASFTVEAWVKLDPVPDAGTGDNYHYIVDKHNANGGWGLRYSESSSAISMTRFYGGTTTDAAYRGSFVLSDKFHHVVGVSDGAATPAKLRLYLDGALLHEEPITGPLTSTGKAVLLGGIASGSNLRGVLDEVAIYGRALPSTRILEHYNKGK